MFTVKLLFVLKASNLIKEDLCNVFNVTWDTHSRASYVMEKSLKTLIEFTVQIVEPRFGSKMFSL